MSLTLEFSVTNPFVKDSFKMMFCKDIRLPIKHKHFSVQFNRTTSHLFLIELWWRDRTYDHRGLLFEFGLLGFSVIMDFYDDRHVEPDWEQG